MLDEFFANAGSIVTHALPEDTVVAFHLRGDGGGVWVLERSGEHVQVLRQETAQVDCRLTCTVEDFRALVNGDLDGTRGFMDGRLEIEGDVGLILGLQNALNR